VAKKVQGAEVKIVATYDDYQQFPDDGKRYEIIEGEVYVTPAPSADHQRVLRDLVLMVAPWVEKKKLGEIFFAPFDVVMDQTNVVQPDLVFIAKEHADRIAHGLTGSPELAVEILSPTTRKRDRTIKLRTYEQHGVGHLWLIDPESHDLEEYVLGKKKYSLATKLAGGAVFEPAVFPGLEVPLVGLWPKK
jgi:Uma2 family endonuclease